MYICIYIHIKYIYKIYFFLFKNRSKDQQIGTFISVFLLMSLILFHVQHFEENGGKCGQQLSEMLKKISFKVENSSFLSTFVCF